MSGKWRISHSEKETEKWAEEIGTVLKPGTVMTLSGEMGTGKTVFVRGLSRGLGADPQRVHSPTFTLCNIYEGKCPVYHIDLFRLRDEEDFIEAGLEEIMNIPDSITVIEWPERISSILPLTTIDIRLEHVDPGKRRLSIPEIVFKDIPAG